MTVTVFYFLALFCWGFLARLPMYGKVIPNKTPSSPANEVVMMDIVERGRYVLFLLLVVMMMIIIIVVDAWYGYLGGVAVSEWYILVYICTAGIYCAF